MHENVVSDYLKRMNGLLAGSRHKFSSVSSREIPTSSGIYAIYDKKLDAIIYIGRTRNLRRRLLGDHKRGNVEGSQFRKALGRHLELKSEGEITAHISVNCSFQFMEIDEFEDMIRLEHFVTAILAPVLNVKLRQ